MNFAANHFRDSYRAEIEGLELQTKIIRDVIKMQMDNEFSANNEVREMLEKTYQLIYEQIDNNWQYYQKEDVGDEVLKRKIKKMGVESSDTQDQLNKLKEIETKKPGMFNAKKQSSDPKQFAEMLGIPYHSLLMLMLNHHERDPLVKTSLHEHTSFIKIQEGYPIFLYETAVKEQNKVKLVHTGKKVGILDFYDSLSILPRIVAALTHSCNEIRDVHQPDNGFMSAAMDLVSLQFIQAELVALRSEQRGELVTSSRDLQMLEDDAIVGNSDKMLFHIKELIASIEDPNMEQNPYVMTKLDMDSVIDFPFDEFQSGLSKKETKRNLRKSKTKGLNNISPTGETLTPEEVAAQLALNDSDSLGTASDEDRSLEDVYQEGFEEEDDDEF